jgi:hypothetical protein
MQNSFSCGLFFFAATVSMVGADDGPSFKVTTKRDDDRVKVNVEKDQAIFSVHSPFGISHAVIEREVEKWPDSVILQLHLKGLENFKITSDKAKLEGSASLQGGKPVARLWKDGKENAPLDAKSPFWMEIRILGHDDKPAKEIPLKDGYFEMSLPQAVFDGNPKSITVNWIDFYRG